MKPIRLIFFSIILGCCFLPGKSQNIHEPDKTTFQLSALGSAATGTNTPFWVVSNRYGTVPMDAGNGYFRSSVLHNQSLGQKGFYWSAGFDALVSAPRDKNVYVHQLFGEIGYKFISLSVGSKELYMSMWDKQLSSGDMIQSMNARPIPEVQISIPHFVTIPFTKGWFHMKGHIAIGRSFDKKYLDKNIDQQFLYTKEVLWHHKSAFARLKDSRGDFPFYLSFGVRHIAQWGGTSTDPKLGKQPQSLKDLIRIFFMKSGGENASHSAQANALGAHHVSYDFQIGFDKRDWAVQAYYQHICGDRSGVLFYNETDGLWGGRLDLRRFRWLNKFVFEYITTKNQSGPFHFIDFDHEKHPGRGGGADNYYNNGEYTTGLSYFNRGIGSPLLPSPEYNNDGSPGFHATRIQDFHFAIEGFFSEQLSYRALLTVMNGWGTPMRPFLKKKTGTSFLIEMNYTNPQLAGWSFGGALAGDTGDMVGDKSFGFSLCIRKQGIIKAWR